MTILTQENPRLRTPSRAVHPADRSVKTLIETLIATVTEQHDPEGVGLAAVQIGIPARVFLAKLNNKYIPFINPKVVQASAEQEVALEGCLSLPNIYGEVRRPCRIQIRFTNKAGKMVTRDYTGLSARIIQHETDHLDGVLFLDHVRKQGGKLFRYHGKDSKGNDLFDEVPDHPLR